MDAGKTGRLDLPRPWTIIETGAVRGRKVYLMAIAED